MVSSDLPDEDLEMDPVVSLLFAHPLTAKVTEIRNMLAEDRKLRERCFNAICLCLRLGVALGRIRFVGARFALRNILLTLMNG